MHQSLIVLLTVLCSVVSLCSSSTLAVSFNICQHVRIMERDDVVPSKIVQVCCTVSKKGDNIRKDRKEVNCMSRTEQCDCEADHADTEGEEGTFDKSIE